MIIENELTAAHVYEKVSAVRSDIFRKDNRFTEESRS